MLPISLHFLVSVLAWCPPSLASCLTTISAFSPLTSRPSSPPAFLASYLATFWPTSSQASSLPSGDAPLRVALLPRPGRRQRQDKTSLLLPPVIQIVNMYMKTIVESVRPNVRSKRVHIVNPVQNFTGNLTTWSSGASSCGPAPAVGGVKPMPAISILCCCQWKRKMGREMFRVTLVLLAYGYWRKSYM